MNVINRIDILETFRLTKCQGQKVEGQCQKRSYVHKTFRCFNDFSFYKENVFTRYFEPLENIKINFSPYKKLLKNIDFFQTAFSYMCRRESEDCLKSMKQYYNSQD